MSDVPRLNMAHGFVKSIVKNQIDRDDFDKDERLRSMAKQERKDRTKRKARAMYVPPHLRTSGAPTKTDVSEDCNEETCTRSLETNHPSPVPHNNSRVILELHLEMKTGSTRKMELHEGEDVKETVKAFALESGLDERLKKALLHKVKQAIGSRSS